MHLVLLKIFWIVPKLSNIRSVSQFLQKNQRKCLKLIVFMCFCLNVLHFGFFDAFFILFSNDTVRYEKHSAMNSLRWTRRYKTEKKKKQRSMLNALKFPCFFRLTWRVKEEKKVMILNSILSRLVNACSCIICILIINIRSEQRLTTMQQRKKKRVPS